MSKFLLIPKNKDLSFNYGFDGFILPLENYSIGFDTYFSVSEINELSKNNNIYVMINKFLHKNDLESITNILSNLKNIKSFFIEDLALTQIIDKNKIILFQNHIITNYESVNYLYDEGIKNVVISNELTFNELKEMKGNTKSTLFYFLINRNMLMYSKRKLISNYFTYNNINSCDKCLNVKEKVSNYELLVKEEGSSTCIFDKKIFVGEITDLDYYIINVNNMTDEEESIILNNYKGDIPINNKDDFFLKNPIGYKVK